MRLRSLGFVALAAALIQSCQPACTPAPADDPTTTAPPPPTSLTVSGQGNGHGRGLSAWGAYGMAVAGSSWEQILDKYYGTGTVQTGADTNRTIGIRLMWADNMQYTTVMSTTSSAMWRGVAYGSLDAEWVGPNTYDVWGAPTVGCGTNGGWQLLERVTGPVTFTTTQDETSAPAGNVLGLCRPDGTVTHYRGAIRVVSDTAGASYVVNDLRIENYLKGVLSREVPARWGDAANGAGMHSLYAMVVAARSFAHNQNRYPGIGAQTCDTPTCQVYGGAAFRRSPDAPTSFPTATQVCESGNLTFECANTNRAIGDLAGAVRIWRSNGRLISGEYSATHGPYSSGVTYPAVDDSVSNVPGNPLYTWTRTVAAADIVGRWPELGTFTGAYSEPDPTITANGVWDNRIVLQGSAAVVVLSNLTFRNAFGFPSHGYTVTGVA